MRLPCTMMRAALVASLAILTTKAANVQPNQNRKAAGRLVDGELSLHLEIRNSLWNPEGENGPLLAIRAFAEEEGPALNPGPLVRVPVGTRVHISVRNLIPRDTMVIHGLHAHSRGVDALFAVAPEASHEVEFRATTPGVFFYWAATGNLPMEERTAADSQLAGAFVVDPPGARQPDRIFVFGHWDDPPDVNAQPHTLEREAWTINGKSWPDTERLTYRAGEHIRWLCVNPTDERHPLHLHGQYFEVEATGDEEHWTRIPTTERRLVATETVLPRGALALSWTAERAGKWLFHCHILFHISADLRLTPAGHDNHETNSVYHMAGLVLGITVTSSKSASVALQPMRHLHLTVGQRQGVDLHGDPGLGYRLEYATPTHSIPVGVFTAPGPTIVLTRGQPVEVAVENQLLKATSVHWHGIELESYYDGVPGWGGDNRHITPPIRPSETFLARFTPPRAGTFIYHTHLNDYVQLSTGLYGPLIVVEPGKRFDPDVDKIFILSRGGTDNEKDPFLINGTATPGAMHLLAGKRYRFRIIGIVPNPVLDVRLERNGEPVEWRPIAKDGVTFPLRQALRGPASLTVNPGETFDFEFRPLSIGSLRLTATSVRFHLQTVLPIEVRTLR